MKKLFLAAALLAVLPWSVSAQVEKQVEVTKAYVPSVESAAKLALDPDMTDTVKLRPEIDYTITPLSLRTTLATRPIRPATVTYWEFNRPLPFYLKVGAGYPLNSVLDFYASSQNRATGYVMGYVNHEGRYADIENDFGVKSNSTRMLNRVGLAAGKYLGRRVLEGELSYDNRLYHRYGNYLPEALRPEALSDAPGSLADYSDIAASVRIGDDFQNLDRTNFEVALHWDMFLDHSDSDAAQSARQMTFGASAKIARAIGRSHFSVEAGWNMIKGQKAFDGDDQQMLRVGARYGLDGGVVRLEAGADYYHDRTETPADPDPFVETGNYLVPFLRLDLNLGTPGLKPFVEADGAVCPNDFRSLTRQNPYGVGPMWLDKSSVDYNGRVGLGGALWRGKFNYRIYAGFSVRDNHLYWTNPIVRYNGDKDFAADLAVPEMARQKVTSFNGEIDYRPVGRLKLSLGVHGYVYDDDTRLENGAPAFEGNIGIRYESRKVSFGVNALMQSERSWTMSRAAADMVSPADLETYRVPFAADLRVDFDWKITQRAGLFAEGRNLLNRKLYEFALYPEYGANFTLGVKLNF